MNAEAGRGEDATTRPYRRKLAKLSALAYPFNIEMKYPYYDPEENSFGPDLKRHGKKDPQ